MPIEHHKSIGSNIRKWRTVKGIKQVTLANEIGISKGTLSKIENDKAAISIQKLQKIAIVLNTRLSLLLTDPSDILRSVTDKI